MVFVIIISLLIFINGYFSAAEIAMVSVRRFRIQQEADNGNKNAARILDQLKKPDEYLSSIQVGVTLVAIIEGLYGGQVLQVYLEARFLLWGISPWLSHVIALFIGIGFITYISILFGELLPKSIALMFPQSTALRLAPSFRVFTLLAYPFVKLLAASNHFLLRTMPLKEPENQKLTDADLKSVLSLAQSQGSIEKNELELHENIFNFYERTIKQIMTPFEKVVWIDEKMTPDVIEGILRKSVHNYFPVLRAKNTVVGYINAKDFFMQTNKSIKDILKPACLIPETQNAPELLRRFEEKRTNFAVVVKDVNVTGVVTIHDIAEVLMGKIS